jgi:hypothetical protein
MTFLFLSLWLNLIIICLHEAYVIEWNQKLSIW